MGILSGEETAMEILDSGFGVVCENLNKECNGGHNSGHHPTQQLRKRSEPLLVPEHVLGDEQN